MFRTGCYLKVKGHDNIQTIDKMWLYFLLVINVERFINLLILWQSVGRHSYTS